MRSDPVYLLKELSRNDATFFIPPYQRNYEWATENCKVLLSDVEKVAKANLSGDRLEHFFGSIVYVVEEGGFGPADKYILTDGQQRITTTMLLLIALRDTSTDAEFKEIIQHKYLQNDRAAEDVEYKIKLKQVETDWDAFKHLVLEQEVPASLTNSTVYLNYTFFKKALQPRSDEQRRALLENGLLRFSIIAIQLEPNRFPWENPQEIFESMNSLGKPLSLADLVRNYLLMGKSAKDQSKLYNQYWLTLEKRLPGRLSDFIRDWMQADQHKSFKVAKESNYKELYSSFKELVQNRSTEDLFHSFVEFSKAYSIVTEVEGTGSKQLDQIISDLTVIGVAPAYSYLTELFLTREAGAASDNDLIEILTALRTYLLRRRIIGRVNPENKFFPTLGNKIPALLTATRKDVALLGQLSAQEYALRLPNDDELSAALRSMNFYNFGRSNNYPKLLLSMAEEYLTKSRPNWEDSNLQLEHIMPQTLTHDWREMLGSKSESIHQELINNIGNITLIRHNQELGNKSFGMKKMTYEGKSGLQVAQNEILSMASWNEQAILSRQTYLVELMSKHLLEVPLEFQHASNWNTKNRDESQFDARVTLNELIGETIHFISNPNITAVVVSDSKVEFEGKQWPLGPLTKELKIRGGAHVSENSNFHGASNWSWDGTRLVDL